MNGKPKRILRVAELSVVDDVTFSPRNR